MHLWQSLKIFRTKIERLQNGRTMCHCYICVYMWEGTYTYIILGMYKTAKYTFFSSMLMGFIKSKYIDTDKDW